MATAIGKSKSISGFDPRSIPGCVLWLDGSDSSTIILTSSSVSQWSDKSGYGLHAVTSGISSATLPIKGTMNGLNTVRFSASGYTALKTPLILPLTNSFGGGASYFVVGQATSSSASSGGRILVSDSQVRQFLVSGTPPAYLQAYSGVNPASFTASIQASVPFVASIVEGNGTMTSYVNGIANATTSATTALTSASFIIGSATTVGNNFDGDIGEILIFQNTLTSLQQQQIEAYLFWKWGVTTTAYPLALTPYVWYDASISGNLTTYVWTDKTGNSRNATQSTLGSVPTWTASVQNGLGGLLFSGAQCFNLPTLTSFNPISIFVVAKATSFTSGAMILSLTASTGIYFRSGGGATNPTYTSYGVDYGSSSYRYVPNSAVTDTNTHLWGFVLPASGLGTFTFDGVVGNAASGFTTSQIGTTYSTGSIGAYGQTASSSPFTGYIFEVIIFNYALSTAQRQSIEGYLNKKWAIYTTKNSIITTNPYYSIQPYSQSFSPLYIDGLQLWMDAADSTTITGSSPVTQWNDKSGNGYNFTASAGPVLATASQNGLNTLTFTAASSQFLSNTSTTRFMELYSLSIFAAFKYSDTTSAGYVFAKSLYGSANGRILFGRDAGTPATFNAGITTTANAYSTYSDAYTANTWRVYGFVADRSAGTVKAYQNGSNNASGTFTVDTTTNLTTSYAMAIGAYNNSSGTLASPQAGLYFNGSIGEILVYSTALTNQQRQQVEGYLSRKWNIPLSNTIISASSSGTINVSFSYLADAIQTWVVPAGVTSLTNVTVNGAGGYSGYQQTSAGRGASVVGTLTVTPGATLSIYVGRCGTVTTGYNQTSTGGWPGGGSANTGEEGGGGGGYSAIANNPVTTYYVIAGAGGGGTGYGGTGGDGGANGSSGTSVNGNNPATGGTQSAGGAGTGGGSSGGYLTGGNASSTTYNGGGGGAGYYGGGGGPGGGAGGLLGGGGGGSSLTSGPGFTLTSVTTGGGGARNTNGSVSFSYTGTTNTYGPHPFGIIPPTLDVQFSPLNLSGLTTLWLDAADTSTIIFGSGSAVYQWSDKSGNNNHVWQPTAINQPTYGLDTTYQKYGIQFTNGGNTVLIPQILSSYPVNSKNYSIFIAFRSTNPVTSTQNIMYTNTGSYTESIYLNYTYTYSIGLYYCYSSINTNINETTTAYTYFSIVTFGTIYLPLAAIYSSIAGSSLSSFVNGTLNASSVRTAPVNHYANYNIGAQSASAGEMSGTIFEIIILNCAASTALQQKIEGYLANKWGLALSSSHPFYKIQTAPSSTYTIPSAVTSVTLSSLSGSGGTITWVAGAVLGVGYQWYVGTALGSGIVASGTVSSSTLTTSFSAVLTVGSTYYGWVISFNSAINSPVVYSTGLIYTAAPGTPVSLVASNTTSTLNMSWTAGSGGTPVTYTVTVYAAGVLVTGSGGTQTISYPTASTTFSPMTSGVAYTFYVSATNTSGTSAIAGPSSGVSYTAPTPVLITATGAGSVSFGTGTQIIIECWGGGGGSMGSDSSTGAGAGGAYAKTTISVSGAFTLYYNVGTGGTGSSGSGSAGGSTWANISANSSPSSTAQGALAAGGAGSGVAGPNNSSQSAGSIGNTVYIGGYGGYSGPENGGGGAASSGGNGGAGTSGSGTAGGSAGTGGGAGGAGGGSSYSGQDGYSSVEGGGGGGGSYNNAGGNGGAPGGAGGMGWSVQNTASPGPNTNSHGYGGNGGRGQIRYTRT
jgi:hypothetical protein